MATILLLYAAYENVSQIFNLCFLSTFCYILKGKPHKVLFHKLMQIPKLSSILPLSVGYNHNNVE